MFVHVIAIGRLMKEEKNSKLIRDIGEVFLFCSRGRRADLLFVKESLGSYQFIFTADSQSVWEGCYWKQPLCHEQ